MSVTSELLDVCKVYYQQRQKVTELQHIVNTRFPELRYPSRHEARAALFKLERDFRQSERLLLQLCASIGQSLSKDEPL
jgi:hypothetical protein